MTHTIFISHAGADILRAQAVAESLAQASIQSILDREELGVGDNFLSFMEGALDKSDYCLLLWSEAASRSRWVQAEWEAAFYRTIQESRRFLVVGRLEEHNPPRLLAPRLRVDLFPELQPGLGELISSLREDDQAADVSGRPVGQPAAPITQDSGGETVYLTSELFSLTIPLQLDLEVPSGIHLDRIRADLGLPSQLDHQGRLGIRMEYRLVREGQVLSRGKSLASQGVAPKDVIWLEVEMKPFAATSPTSGSLEPAIFRSVGRDEDPLRAARRLLLSFISRAGLGF